MSLAAPGVFLRSTLTVDVKGGGESSVEAPALGRVSIQANPDNCKVYIDGAFVDDPPILEKKLREPNADADAAQEKWAVGAAKDAKLPANIKAILGVEPAKRNDAQKRDLTKFFRATAPQFKTVNDEYAGPRLQAAIRASQTFMPRTFWTAYLGSHDELLEYYEAETFAIVDRDPDAARAACVGRAEAMGRIMLAELVRRRVLAPPAPSRTSRPLHSE